MKRKVSGAEECVYYKNIKLNGELKSRLDHLQRHVNVSLM